MICILLFFLESQTEMLRTEAEAELMQCNYGDTYSVNGMYHKEPYSTPTYYYYLIKIRRDHSPSQYGPCYGSHQGDIQPSKHVTDHPGFTK